MTSAIERNKKTIFIHVQKCAGQSVCKVLRDLNENHGHDWEFSQSDDERHAIMQENNLLLGSNYKNPRHLRAIDARKLLGAELYDESFKFAISRNPWDRLTSWYHYLRRTVAQEKSAMIRQMTLEDFVNYSCDPFFLPQWHWVMDEHGNQIVDKVIKMEDLDTAWPDIIKKFHSDVILMERLNTSQNSKETRKVPPFAQVREVTLDKFRKAYAKDFELFGYDDSIPENRSVNSNYTKFESLWKEEVENLTAPETLSENHKVDLETYLLYRDTNSSQTYTSFLQEKLSQQVTNLSKQRERFESVIKQKETQLAKQVEKQGVTEKKLKADFDSKLAQKEKLLAKQTTALENLRTRMEKSKQSNAFLREKLAKNAK